MDPPPFLCLLIESSLSLQDDLLVYRSDAPLPEVFRPLHQTPSSHRPFINSHPDPADFAELSDESSDEEPLKRRRVRSPKPALVVPKTKDNCVQEEG